MNNFIVVLPYTETSRLFHASKTTNEEAFVGETDVVYYQYQAKKMSEQDAKDVISSHTNNKAFIRSVN